MLEFHNHSHWKSNMEALKRKRPELHQIILNHKPKQIGQILPTKTLPNLIFDNGEGPILAYNGTDPMQDPSIHLQNISENNHNQICIFIGMGLGYSPLLIFNKRPNTQLLIIIEPSLDLFYTALQFTDLCPLIFSNKVFFFIGSIDWQQIEQALSKFILESSYYLLCHEPSFQWNPNLYNNIKENSVKLFNQLASEGRTNHRENETSFYNLMENLTLFPHAHQIKALKGIFRNLPALIVAPGPSLTQSLPLLKKIKDSCILIAADGALGPLLHDGIYPDFVTAIDFRDINFEKVTDYIKDTWPFYLVSLGSATSFIPKRLSVRHLFFAFSQNEGYNWILKPLGFKEVEFTINSVTHLSLGLAIITEANPIIFVGQDLAYTEKKTHADNTVFSDSTPTKDCLWVTDIHGEEIKTSLFFLEFKNRIEKAIKQFPRTYINASAAGAHIDGTMVLDLSHVIDNYLNRTISVQPLVNDAVNRSASPKASILIDLARKNLYQIDLMLKNIQNASAQLSKTYIAAKRAKDLNITNPENLPPDIKKEFINLHKKNKIITQKNDCQYIDILTISKVKENERLISENAKKFSTNYISFLESGLEQIEFVHKIKSEALNIFKNSLNKLLNHLTEEDILLKQYYSKNGTYQDGLALAKIYIKSEDIVLARPILEKIIKEYPNSDESQFQMGIIHAYLFNFKEAFAAWDKAKSLNPNLAENINAIRKELGLLWLENFKTIELYPIKRSWMKRVIEISGDLPYIKQEIYNIWQKNKISVGDSSEKQLKMNIFIWEAAQEILPEWYIMNAKLLAINKDLKNSISFLNKALKIHPEKAEWIALMARYLIEGGLYDEGLEKLNQAVALDPQTATLWEELGDALFDMGDFSSAIRSYEHCFIALPYRIETLKKLGDCYLSNNQPQAAITAYQEVLKKDPNHSEALKQMLIIQKMI
ncbi:MAG: DUF115 domain-containing protein [Desulfobacterales bacterium]|nr:DUF115 domain-containing protein [Desulfobacterales bacterium]